MDYVASKRKETKPDILCNCSKPRCVYYLCRCFAARLYCDCGCGCRCGNCHNKPYFEDTGCGNSASSSSAGHKKGCQCPVIKCLKKSCECYRHEGGCSKKCPCQDCDNSFGKKPEQMLQGAEYWKNRSHQMPYTGEVMSGSIKVGNANPLWPTWENLTYTNHLSISTHPHSSAVPSLTSHNIRALPSLTSHNIRAVPSLTSHNIREYQNVSLAESRKGTNVHGYSPASIPKQPFPSKGLSSLLSINDIHKELVDGNIDVCETIGLLSFLHPSFFDDIHEMLDSNSIDTMKSESPGQLTATWMPCSPTPTTCCNSEDSVNQTEIDRQGGNYVTNEWNADTQKINNPWNYNGRRLI